MRRNALATVTLTVCALALSGCAAAEPPAPRDETLYIESVRALGGDLGQSTDEASLVEHGDVICQTAKDNDTNIEGAREVLGGMLEAQGATAAQMEYWAAVAAGAGSFLCNEYAE